MQKNFKRFLALFMTFMLIFSIVPTTVFAEEVPPGPESTVPGEMPQEPAITPAPEAALEPSQEPSAEPDTSELAPGTELDMDRIWPALQRAQARAAAGVGTSGTLYVGDYCFTSAVGVPPTLGEYIGLMPVETMRFGSNNVAAYCLEHVRFVP